LVKTMLKKSLGRHFFFVHKELTSLKPKFISMKKIKILEFFRLFHF